MFLPCQHFEKRYVQLTLLGCSIRFKSRFVNLEASEAIALLVSDRPVRFQLRLPSIPLISYTSAADHTIKDALDAIATQADWMYELTDGTIHVQDLETRTLLLLAQPGIVEATMSVNSLDTGSSSGGESDGGTVQHSSDPYRTELEPVITELVAGDLDLGIPSTARLLPNANALLVTARPSTVDALRRSSKSTTGAYHRAYESISPSTRFRLARNRPSVHAFKPLSRIKPVRSSVAGK